MLFSVVPCFNNLPDAGRPAGSLVGGTLKGIPMWLWTSRNTNGQGQKKCKRCSNKSRGIHAGIRCFIPVIHLLLGRGGEPSRTVVSKPSILGVKNAVKLKNQTSSPQPENDGSPMEFTSGLATSWERTPFLNEREIYAIQPSVLFHPGSLQLLCRTKQSKIYTAWSGDNGRKWTELMPLCLPNPDAGIDALTLANGKFLVVYNHLSAGRHILNTAVSENGTDWKAIALLEKGHQGSEYSYPAVIQTNDGLVHITYTWERRLIKHVVIDPAKVSALPMLNGMWPEEHINK